MPNGNSNRAWTNLEALQHHRAQRLKELGTSEQEQQARNEVEPKTESEVKQELGRRGAANICPVCGERKQDVKDRSLTKNYVPGQADDSHLLSCGGCFEELEGPHGR